MNIDTLTAFERAYLECALWSSCDPDTMEPLDDNYSIEDIAPSTLAEMLLDCADFQNAQKELLEGLDDSQCGHDFWLTRNRHGAGFWDRGLGEIGEKLTEASHAYGSVDLYVADDGIIYC